MNNPTKLILFTNLVRKINLSIFFLSISLATFSQTPRMSLYEEFTGEMSPPCALNNPPLNLLLASPTNTPKIVVIKWQVPFGSAPSNTWSLYQTNNVEIDWRYKSVAAGGYGYVPTIFYSPQGRIDGQDPTVFGAASAHVANLTNTVISTAQSYTSAFSISVSRAWDSSCSSINLTVSIAATANFNATGALIFRTVMVENNIDFPTAPGLSGETHFENVAIKSFPTLQSGISMASNWIIGQTQTFTLNCPIPSYTRKKEEIAFVGFIQDDGNKTIAQATRVSKAAVPSGPINIISAGTNSLGAICSGNSVTLTTNAVSNYSWSNGSTSNSIVVSPTITTNYSLSATSSIACTGFATSSITVNECVGIINQNIGLGGVSIYPHPNNGEFIIELISINNTYITITNVLGQIIKTQKAELINQINLNLFEKGVYFISVMDNNQSVYRGSIIKE